MLQEWKREDPFLRDIEGYELFIDVKNLEAEYEEKVKGLNYKLLYREYETVRCKFCGFPAGSYGWHENKHECLYCYYERCARGNQAPFFPLPTHAPPKLLQLTNLRENLMRTRIKLILRRRKRNESS